MIGGQRIPALILNMDGWKSGLELLILSHFVQVKRSAARNRDDLLHSLQDVGRSTRQQLMMLPHHDTIPECDRGYCIVVFQMGLIYQNMTCIQKQELGCFVLRKVTPVLAHKARGALMTPKRSNMSKPIGFHRNTLAMTSQNRTFVLFFDQHVRKVYPTNLS